MEENEKFEVDFYKLNLNPNDILVLKVNIEGLDKEQTEAKLNRVINDEFVSYVESKGNKVIVTYTGIDFSVLRMEENDKILSYIDVSQLNEEDSEKYVDRVINFFKKLQRFV